MSAIPKTSITAIVDDNGMVAVPNDQPGDTVTVTIEPPRPPARERTEEEQVEIFERLDALRKWVAEELTDEDRELFRTHADWIYDENGLPAW
jgi:hypothetical protein